MYALIRSLILVSTTTVMLIGCGGNVPLKKVYGTYKASYPIGIETITLNEDGSFSQKIVMKDHAPVTLHGKWDFDSQGSRVNFDRLIMVVDGAGHVKGGWYDATPGIASLDVEMHWFRTIMASAATYPYIKQ